VNDIVNNGLVRFNRADTYTYDSAISGTGDVEQIGSGTTILTGENTYTGSTTIRRGRLQLGDGGDTGSIDHTSGIMIEQDGTLTFNRSDLKIIDRVISGTGTIEQIGSGITRLTADSSGFTGNTQVNAGTLSVNGILGGTVDVNDGGTLEGLGTVGSTIVHAGGTIAPGNSIGTLTIDGYLIQEPGSFYQAEVMSTGETDLIYVRDTATIEDGAILNVTKLDPARYELEHRYTVLTAEGGLTGEYILTGDTWVSAFYRIQDHYDANNVYLDVWQHRLFQEAGWTVNQTAAATAAQELKWQRDPDAQPSMDGLGYPSNELFRAIAYLQTDEEARYAFDQISGELYASIKAALLEESRHIRDVSVDRIRAAFGAGRPQKVLVYEPGIDIKDPTPRPVWIDSREAEGLVFWGNAFGARGEVEGDGNAARLDQSVGGLLIGADIPIREIFRIGLLGGYSRSKHDVDDRHSTARSNNYHIGIYGGAEWRRLGARIGASYSWHDLSTERSVVFPGFAEHLTADFDAATLQVYGDLGYAFHLGGVNLEPFLGLAYANLHHGGFNEKGGVAALSGSSGTLDAFYGTLGLRVSRDIAMGDMDVTAHGMVGWRHSFERILGTSRHAFAGSSNFTVYGAPVAQGIGLVEAGLDAALNEKLTLGISYSGQFGDNVETHGVRGKVNWRF
jgi:outer membrane autotransporter protein